MGAVVILDVVITLISAVFVLFVPGFAVSFVFFKKDAIDMLERIGLSFALSVALIPLLTFYINLLGVKITRGLVIYEVVTVVCLAFFVNGIRSYLRK